MGFRPDAREERRQVHEVVCVCSAETVFIVCTLCAVRCSKQSVSSIDCSLTLHISIQVLKNIMKSPQLSTTSHIVPEGNLGGYMHSQQAARNVFPRLRCYQNMSVHKIQPFVTTSTYCFSIQNHHLFILFEKCI